MAQLIEFETQRLKLRQWVSADFDLFAQLNADPLVMEFFPAILSRQESHAMALRIQTDIANRGWGFWAAELKSTAEFIGFVGLHIPSMQLPFSPCVEIGWRLAAKYWGQGFATEAARQVLRVGFDELELSEIVSFTAVPNVRSRAVMQKIGMQQEVQTFEHPDVPIGHRLRKHYLYRAIKKS